MKSKRGLHTVTFRFLGGRRLTTLHYFKNFVSYITRLILFHKQLCLMAAKFWRAFSVLTDLRYCYNLNPLAGKISR